MSLGNDGDWDTGKVLALCKGQPMLSSNSCCLDVEPDFSNFSGKLFNFILKTYFKKLTTAVTEENNATHGQRIE